jgi:hypothetical protein
MSGIIGLENTEVGVEKTEDGYRLWRGYDEGDVIDDPRGIPRAGLVPTLEEVATMLQGCGYRRCNRQQRRAHPVGKHFVELWEADFNLPEETDAENGAAFEALFQIDRHAMEERLDAIDKAIGNTWPRGRKP